MIYDIHVFDLISAFIVLYVKRKDDVLVGFSRLTDLIKISIFQLYKNKKLTNEKSRL